MTVCNYHTERNDTMKKNVISVATSVMLIFTAGTSAAAEQHKTKQNNADIQISYTLPQAKQTDISARIITPENENNCIENDYIEFEAEHIPVYAPENTVTKKNAEYGQGKNQTCSNSQTFESTSKTVTSASSSYSENDVYWLSRLIEAEASGESYEGKSAVGGCVINRVKSPDFPNTVYGVIFDKAYGVQYQPTANGAIYNTPSADSIRAAEEALKGISTAGNALYFCSTTVAPKSWAAANRAYCMTIGNHVFYL